VLFRSRRAKYLLLRLDQGSLILHLGMSGSLRLLPAAVPPGPHDHLDLVLEDGNCLRLRDPRRFGALLWTPGNPLAHPLLRDLGPEPLGDDFDGEHLYRLAQHRRLPVKSLIMDGRVVVGVGNIYASEALFRARIHPQRAAGLISLERYRQLATAIRTVLEEAIVQGGTTLRDFSRVDGRPGYFALSLQVYGKGGTPCPACGAPLQELRIGQRSSFFCAQCQD
jgi:formamidopyrimidine-DNA glycosylase